MKRYFMAALLLCFVILVISPVFADSYAITANEATPGQPFDIKKLATPGQMTIVEFYSPYCPSCMQVAKGLEQLDRKRSDITVYKLNINRGMLTNKIDWLSPLALQYKIHYVPYFFIFNEKGQVTSGGESATDKVKEILTKEGL